MIIQENVARQILEPIMPKILECINSAIRDYKKIDIFYRTKYLKRTRANIINDYMLHNAQELLLDIPGIRWGRRGNSFYFLIQDKFKLKFKMFDKNLRSKNIPTRQSLAFVNQQDGLLFPDLPDPVTNIIAGYKWNPLQTDHNGIYIVCPHGFINAWVLELTSEKAAPQEVIPQVIPLHTPERKKRTVPRKPERKKRVVPRKVDGDVKNNDEK